MGLASLIQRSAVQALDGLARVLLPPLCPLCRSREPAGASPFCSRCQEGLPRLAEPFCTRCGLPFPGVGPSHPCHRCLGDPPAFDALRTWGVYDGGLLEAIRSLKYGGQLTGRRALVDLLLEAFDRFGGGMDPSAVVPVPCHPATLRRRGFDLPALLSRGLARARHLAWRPGALVKVSETPDLTELSAPARARAVARAYQPGEPLTDTVLLVDDVVTSTSTARACARACLEAGAHRVYVLALARTPLTTP